MLLDVGVSYRLIPALREALGGMPIETARFHNWHTLRNGELLARASTEGFTTLLTTDKRLVGEQPTLPMAVIALDDNRLPGLLLSADRIADAIRNTEVGQSRIFVVDP